MTTSNDKAEFPLELHSPEEQRRLFGLLTGWEWDVAEGEKWPKEKILEFAYKKDQRLDEMHARIKAGKTGS